MSKPKPGRLGRRDFFRVAAIAGGAAILAACQRNKEPGGPPPVPTPTEGFEQLPELRPLLADRAPEWVLAVLEREIDLSGAALTVPEGQADIAEGVSRADEVDVAGLRRRYGLTTLLDMGDETGGVPTAAATIGGRVYLPRLVVITSNRTLHELPFRDDLSDQYPGYYVYSNGAETQYVPAAVPAAPGLTLTMAH